MVEVRDVQGTDHYISPLEGIGYPHWAGNPNPDRILFVKFVDADRPSRTHNVYVVEMGGDLWNDGLVFRGYPRAHPETVREYAQLKHELASRFRDDREAYIEDKMGFFSTVVEWAKASRA